MSKNTQTTVGMVLSVLGIASMIISAVIYVGNIKEKSVLNENKIQHNKEAIASLSGEVNLVSVLIIKMAERQGINVEEIKQSLSLKN